MSNNSKNFFFRQTRDVAQFVILISDCTSWVLPLTELLATSTKQNFVLARPAYT